MMLKFENVFFNYDKNEVLKNISLTIKEKELLYILGPNGSGKTTLINLINGLIKPKKGKITKKVLNISTLYQTPVNAKNFPARVDEIITSSYNRKAFLSKKAFLTYYEYLLNLMEIKNLQHKLIGELSGGELQRVMFIKTIINKPKFLILDEPTSAIDPSFRKKFLKILEDLNKTTTIILITHDLSGLDPYCKNKVIYLDREIKFYGSYCDYHKKYGGKNEHHV